MRKVFLSLIIIIGALTSTGVSAITFFGAPDCGGWIKSMTPGKKFWLMGFLSGLNSALADAKINYDPLNQLSSSDQAYVWMDNYCKNNPLSDIGTGANALFSELMAKEKKK